MPKYDIVILWALGRSKEKSLYLLHFDKFEKQMRHFWEAVRQVKSYN